MLELRAKGQWNMWAFKIDGSDEELKWASDGWNWDYKGVWL